MVRLAPEKASQGFKATLEADPLTVGWWHWWRRIIKRRYRNEEPAKFQSGHTFYSIVFCSVLLYSVLFYYILLYCISVLIYSVVGCVLPLQEAGFGQVLQLSLPFAILVYTIPRCPTVSSLQRRFGLHTDLIPFICHSVLLMIHLLSFICEMCPAQFHFALATHSAMSVTMSVTMLLILSLNLAISFFFSFFLSAARWLVSRFFTEVL